MSDSKALLPVEDAHPLLSNVPSESELLELLEPLDSLDNLESHLVGAETSTESAGSTKKRKQSIVSRFLERPEASWQGVFVALLKSNECVLAKKILANLKAASSLKKIRGIYKNYI